MGKTEGEHTPPSTTLDAQGTNRQNADNSNGWCFSCSKLKKEVTLRCVLVLLLGVAVFLSAIFWLPFLHFGCKRDLDLDYAGHDIVASFMLRKPASFLRDYNIQLENDIFEEMSYASTKVEIISLESSAGSNTTKVVFAVEADLTTQSLIRSLFVDLITHRTRLQLTSASLFGEPFSFDVLKFKRGITASPDQRAFLMQNDQILFNFTLNFSMDQILNNFNDLRVQLKTGLHLTPYESLYIRLTNLKGSTLAPPTTVQSQVLLAIGIDPSKRLKQLAQTVGSHSENLGLNDTVFGKVKQVRLSSILQHSLNNVGGYGPSPSPTHSPYHSPENHYHHHHHHHHNHFYHHSPTPSMSSSPSVKSHGPVHRKRSHVSRPVYAPSLGNNKPMAPPPFHFGSYPWKHNNKHYHSHLVPSKSPSHEPIASPGQPKPIKYPNAPKVAHVPVLSPLPVLSYSHNRSPSSNDESHAVQTLPLVSPSHSTRIFSYIIWGVIQPFLLTILLL